MPEARPSQKTHNPTVQSALAEARRRLSPTSETAGLDAQVLLAHVTGRERAWVLAHPEAPLSSEQAKRLQAALARLEAGEPLPYVLGEWEFFGLRLAVSPAVLIPRPETELLVETALDWLHAHASRHRAAEAGTGSGCIAAALAAHVPDLRLAATDISRGALEIARSNLERHRVEKRVRLAQADLLAPLSGSFDLICANLPYIPTARLRELPVHGREPAQALDGGPDGLQALRRLLAQAPRLLVPGGALLAEIDASQREAAGELARAAFPDAQVSVRPDLAGLPRLLLVQT